MTKPQNAPRPEKLAKGGLHDIAATAKVYHGCHLRVAGQNPIATPAELAARRKSERLEMATSTTPIRNSTMRGPPYTCPELRTNPYRPGSADASRLPSRTSFASQKETDA